MIEPRLLSQGDRIAVVAPAGRLVESGISRAITLLESWGLEVIVGKNVYGQSGYFSGTDQERLTDLQNAIEDPTIAAILCARGGYGITRILDQIDCNPLLSTPTWIIGFSDITAFHLKLVKEGILSIHGDVGTTLGRSIDASNSLKELLFEGKSFIKSNEPVRPGSVQGKMIGGNLSLIIDSLGTPTEIDTKDHILFIEEIGEKTYRIDRMLHQLDRAGVFKQIKGLVIGQFTEILDGSDKFGATWKESIINILDQYEFPVAFGFPIGHEPENHPFVHGGQYQLDVDKNQAMLTYKPI